MLIKRLQWDAEELFQHSMEVFVSYDDFIFNVNHANDSICKFRVDKYYIFAYTTNSNVTVHDLRRIWFKLRTEITVPFTLARRSRLGRG